MGGYVSRRQNAPSGNSDGLVQTISQVRSFQQTDDSKFAIVSSKQMVRIRRVVVIPRKVQTALYIAFGLAATVACYFRPIPGDYDRYVYEVVARSQMASWLDVYPVLKTENPRLALSPGFDSAEHMAELEPIFAIRPLYIEAIQLLHGVGFDYQTAVSLIAASSFFAIAIILFVWTQSPLLSALAISTTTFIQLGRQGVPDGLNALCIVAALYALIVHQRLALAVSLLLVSIWIRTDSVLICWAALAWLCYQKKLKITHGAALAVLGFVSVEAINHFSGNYGYAVLFRATFIGGNHPLLISAAHISAWEYLSAIKQGVPSIVPQVAPWCLVAIAAWRFHSQVREWLLPVWGAAFAHFLLFPSPESRYLNWAFVFSAIAFIEAVQAAATPLQCSTQTAASPVDVYLFQSTV
jgi:hypothetical protein